MPEGKDLQDLQERLAEINRHEMGDTDVSQMNSNTQKEDKKMENATIRLFEFLQNLHIAKFSLPAFFGKA